MSVTDSKSPVIATEGLPPVFGQFSREELFELVNRGSDLSVLDDEELRSLAEKLEHLGLVKLYKAITAELALRKSQQTRSSRRREAAAEKRLIAAAVDISGGTLSPAGLTQKALMDYMSTLAPDSRQAAMTRFIAFKRREQEIDYMSMRARKAAEHRKAQKTAQA